ncbi:interleukin-18-like isoform X2 [Eleutherodactylus coqui]|uniref:interleukin-18-like isoform X2 n=1 Tax=Eleutherodactylus coqui TaxID=57060 RepID=UPI0034638390
MEMTAVEIDFDLCEILDGILHFKDGLETDAWKKSRSSITGMIMNIFEHCLVAHPDDLHDGGAVFANPGSDCQTFELQIYRTTSPNDGLSVAFTVNYNGDKYHMCCTEDMKIYFKKGDSPERIDGNLSEIIFFQKQFSEGDESFKFQSALKAGYYLAVSDEGGQQKLILKSHNGLNERERFTITH